MNIEDKAHANIPALNEALRLSEKSNAIAVKQRDELIDKLENKEQQIYQLKTEVERLTAEFESSEKANAIGAKQNDDLLDKLEDATRQIAMLKKALETAIHRVSPNSTDDVVNAIATNLMEETEDQLTHETHEAEK
ncbi:MAG: hypothetical protein WC900_07565 [Oscillospiraceae bacterium]|jgi:regulator of replication initiation timing